jgi:hypothetical protein
VGRRNTVGCRRLVKFGNQCLKVGALNSFEDVDTGRGEEFLDHLWCEMAAFLRLLALREWGMVRWCCEECCFEWEMQYQSTTMLRYKTDCVAHKVRVHVVYARSLTSRSKVCNESQAILSRRGWRKTSWRFQSQITRSSSPLPFCKSRMHGSNAHQQ